MAAIVKIGEKEKRPTIRQGQPFTASQGLCKKNIKRGKKIIARGHIPFHALALFVLLALFYFSCSFLFK